MHTFLHRCKESFHFWRLTFRLASLKLRLASRAPLSTCTEIVKHWQQNVLNVKKPSAESFVRPIDGATHGQNEETLLKFLLPLNVSVLGSLHIVLSLFQTQTLSTIVDQFVINNLGLCFETSFLTHTHSNISCCSFNAANWLAFDSAYQHGLIWQSSASLVAMCTTAVSQSRVVASSPYVHSSH